MQYLMCEADMGYELSWLLISLSSHDSRDSCKMFIRKARGAAVEMCSARRRAHLPDCRRSLGTLSVFLSCFSQRVYTTQCSKKKNRVIKKLFRIWIA